MLLQGEDLRLADCKLLPGEKLYDKKASFGKKGGIMMTVGAKRLYTLLQAPKSSLMKDEARIFQTAEEVLTIKQWLVFRMKIKGLKNRDIARKMGVSEATASEHWVKSMEKVAAACKYLMATAEAQSAKKGEVSQKGFEDSWIL